MRCGGHRPGRPPGDRSDRRRRGERRRGLGDRVIRGTALHRRRLQASGTSNLAVLAGSEIDWDQSQHADGTIYALETHGEHLYAGGDFVNVGFSSVGVPPKIPPMFFESNLARTSGTNWEEAFAGTDGTVYALHSVDSGSNQGLYIGGAFDEIAAESGRNGLARYDGVAVEDMDGGVDGSVYAIQRWAGGIAVGGLYLSAGDSGMPAFNIATWDESTGWSAMDSGVFGSVIDAPHGAPVLALCSHGDGTTDGLTQGATSWPTAPRNDRTCTRRSSSASP